MRRSCCQSHVGVRGGGVVQVWDILSGERVRVMDVIKCRALGFGRRAEHVV